MTVNDLLPDGSGRPTDGVIVRTAGAADAPALAELRWQWRVDEKGEPGPDRADFLAWFTAWVVEHLDSHRPFLADLDGQPVGMAWLLLAPRVPSPVLTQRRMGDVQAVYVRPELRDRGVGAVLIDTVLAYARDQGLELVTVHSAERAVPFYLRRGFGDQHTWLEWRP